MGSAKRKREVPDTPGALRKACERATTSDSERIVVGCALLLASRIEQLELQAARVLDVLLKRTNVEAFEQAMRAVARDLVVAQSRSNEATLLAVSCRERIDGLVAHEQLVRMADLVELRAKLDALAMHVGAPGWSHGLQQTSLPTTTSNACSRCDADAVRECRMCGAALCASHLYEHEHCGRPA